MDRSKRAIKTPKRFDDEAFETPPKSQQPTKPVEAAKPTPEQPTAKSIIKVKLTTKVRSRESAIEQPPDLSTPKQKDTTIKATKQIKIKPREIVKPTPTKESAAKQPKDEPASGESIAATKPTKEASSPGLSEASGFVKLKETPVKLAKEPTKPKDTVVKIKEPAKSKDPTKIREPGSVGRPPKELVKLRETQLGKPQKIDIKAPVRDVHILYRPRSKRPRTPPVFADIMPNVVLPFWDAKTAAEDHEDDNVKELVHCHCSVGEELGLMVQCETCLTWQHAHCLGIERPEDAPDGYTCRACSDPKFARESMKWAYDQDWLTKGRMKQFPCDSNPIPERNINVLRQINGLIANVLNIHQLIHSLKIKTRLLMNANDDDPELKLFRVQWSASYQHRDGAHFIPTINHPSSTPASTISVIGETPDPCDITVETVADVALPDIGQLEDVSAILENPYVSNPPIQPMATNHDVTPNDCRANLRLHIQQTEEFIGIELAQIEEQLVNLEKECSLNRSGNLETSLDSLKNDLQTMKKHIALNSQFEN